MTTRTQTRSGLKFSKTLLLVAAVVANLSLTACGNGFAVQSDGSQSNNSASSGGETTPNDPGDGTTAPVVTPGPMDEDLGICGTLNYDGVVWPMSFDVMDRRSLALSLNITGSYEGISGWTNLTNNFDGEGLSLGLLQQNLGTGSLQPMLLNMMQKHYDVMAKIFTAADLNSLSNMLDAWGGSAMVLSKAQGSDALFPDQDQLSPLDNPSSTQVSAKALASGTTGSVQWAVANLYQSDGTTFIPRWKTELKALAATPEYRSLQVAAALSINNQAAAYFKYFGFTELRMMLLMFDFVTQNGGFNSTHKSAYNAYIAGHPNATETARAKALLDIRLTSVRAAYVTDVKQRKTTIIDGTGTVHGDKRNLPVEYCYTPTEKM